MKRLSVILAALPEGAHIGISNNPTNLGRSLILLVVREEERDDPRLQKLAAELKSADVARFIEHKYQGAVLPGTPVAD